MQYEILYRGGKYKWFIYSKYGYPLRDILKQGESDSWQHADSEAYFEYKRLLEKGLQ